MSVVKIKDAYNDKAVYLRFSDLKADRQNIFHAADIAAGLLKENDAQTGTYVLKLEEGRKGVAAIARWNGNKMALL